MSRSQIFAEIAGAFRLESLSPSCPVGLLAVVLLSPPQLVDISYFCLRKDRVRPLPLADIPSPTGPKLDFPIYQLRPLHN